MDDSHNIPTVENQPIDGLVVRSQTRLQRFTHRLLPVLALTLFSACGEEEQPIASTEQPDTEIVATPTAPPNLLLSSKYNATSVRTTGRVIVRDAPDTNADRMGLIAKDTRFKPLRMANGPGCELGWIEVAPDRWVCGKNLEPDEREPEATEQPIVEEGQVIPAIYGDVRNSSAVLYPSVAAIKKGQRSTRQLSGHTVLRRVDEVDVDGKIYWKIASGEYILAADLKPYKPSDFHGVFLGKGLDLPLVFIMPRPAFDRPAIESPSIVPVAAGRGIAKVLEKAPAGRGASAGFKYRIGADEWVSGSNVRFVQEVSAPEDIQQGEHWIDINLKQQVLVAYEGFSPVYATLISSGRLDPTPRGIFRIYLKFGETSMGSEMGDDRPYLIENVPWTQFFQAGIALHCAFWHNGFGYPRSRGCVNLAPIDARWLYNWASPEPPLGWTSLHASTEHPGTMVRVWADENEPLYYYGYARDVAKARGVKVKSAPSLKEQMEATKADTLKKSGQAAKPAEKPGEKPGEKPAEATSDKPAGEKSSGDKSSSEGATGEKRSPSAPASLPDGSNRASEGDKPSDGASPRN